MVIQKFVADIERTKWPSVVVIPSVVISELDWYVGPIPECPSSGRQWSEPRLFRSPQAKEYEEERLLVRSCRV